ncbi:MAG: acylneuraminate cytidylyltransferase [Balneolaceae bacterium]|nr:MAG: acylneuraminate cytidylyltransferase [Balneolaceae bacterium]
MKLPDIKLFITDIDGVWTDGGMIYGSNGVELKKFITADSAGVLLLKLLHIPTAIITGEETRMVSDRAEKLQIRHVFQGIRNKVACAEKLIQNLGVSLEETAFIGDDLNDMNLLSLVGLSACPENAPDYVKRIVDWPLPVRGGDGVFRFFVEKYLNETGRLEEALSRSGNFFSDQEGV